MDINRLTKRKTLTLFIAALAIFILMPLMCGKAHAAQEITIQGGEYKISDLIKSPEEGGYALTSEDTLKVGYNTTIVADMGFTINKIMPLTTGPSLIIKGDNTLTVASGINLAQGTFTMESGTLQITGTYPGINPTPGIYASNVIINGGNISIAFDDTVNSNQCGFRTPAFTMNDGQVVIDISGAGSGMTCGIWSQDSSGYTTIKGGTLYIDVENSFGYPYGIYNATYPGYVVEIKGGTTNIKAKRTGDGNYADAGGIRGANNSIYVSAGSLTVDVTNAGQDATGITGEYFNISGGTLDVYAGTSKEGREGCGIKTDDDATFLMSGGTVTVQGQTYTTSSGEGVGIRYYNTSASKHIDVSGGTLTAIGTTDGIYVYNGTDDTPGQNQIYGIAKVTISGGQYGINGARDNGGWMVSGEAELTVTGTQSQGLYTEGPLIFADTPVVVLERETSGGSAVYAYGGITIGDLLVIANPIGGAVSTDGKDIVDSDNHSALKVGIQPKDVVKANVLFLDESTGHQITSPVFMVYKNTDAWQAGGGDPVRFSVGKGENFTLTTGMSDTTAYGTEYLDYEFVGWYKNVYPGTPLTKNSTTPTQNITSDTWYYAVYSPPKTVITSMTFTTDKTPLPGMTRADKPTVTVQEEGITVTGTAWLDTSGHHLPESYVFTSGDSVMLMIDYSVNSAYKLSSDIESNTTVNESASGFVNDVPGTAVYVYYTVPSLITTVDIGEIWNGDEHRPIDPINPIPFTTEVHDEFDTDGVNFNDKMEILAERWTSGGEAAIEAPDSGVPTVGRTYVYNIVLGAKDGWAFGDSFTFIVGGETLSSYDAVVSPDHKSVWLCGFQYAQVNPVDISAAEVTGISDMTYTGKPLTPAPAVQMTVNGTAVTLDPETDFTVSYTNNTNNGTATVTITGTGKFTGTVTKTFAIIAAGDDPEKMGTDGTPVGPGASAAAAEAAITSATSDEGPAGTKYAPLMAKSTKQTKNSVKLTWAKVNGAVKYVIYANKCGKTNKMQKLTTVTGASYTAKKAAGAKIKKGTYYKFMIVALDKDNLVVSTSKTVHAATAGGKVGNATKITTKAKKNKVTVKVKKTFKLAAKQAGKNIKKHRVLKYESSDTKIATVTAKGIIKGVKKGSCYVYAYAQNGVFAKIKVTVK